MFKKTIPFLLFSFVLVLSYCTLRKADVKTSVKEHLQKSVDTLDQQAAHLLNSANKGEAELRNAFLSTRVAYKKLEWFSEYYAPTTSKELNGAPLPEIEIEETKVFEPSGLQVIEEYVYPYNPATKADLLREIASFRSSLKRLRMILNDTEFTEAHILDACKLEVFRVIGLGISGFDTPLSKTGIEESAVALAAVANVLKLFGENEQLQEQINAAIKYIGKSPDFDRFNRAEFITQYADPISEGILAWQNQLGIQPLNTEMALRNKAATLFDKDAFNINHFVNTAEAMPDAKKIALGKALFFDPVISGATRSCSHCHQPQLAFTDGMAKSAALAEGRFVKRNSPTLMYAGLQDAQFYDMRAKTLEGQATDVIANKDEMHASVEEAARRLEGNSQYFKQFKAAFSTMDNTIRPRYVMIALASYVRSLAPFNSRFDQYMRGNKSKLTANEVNGFNLFMGKAKCGTCHFTPLFNGTAPPTFANTEAEVLGVPADPRAKHPVVDPDEGRSFHSKIEEIKYAFKTPTLRNIALTAPYMHNGAFKTLEEVMDFYEKGGGAGIGIKLDNQTLATDKLNLTEQEKKDIIAFLKALTDE
ncbi:cytochrome-c peroxidase [Mucilaginibacter auburnensis]|uniref:Cytochrome c peroxidase n=1 Tax=Mucilaginibacter auburnensis TaxID=1457233 RepID=A0A2H9VT99_9SPHI|nr:cytochrome c peroxidase [Mucilaginibacter auburnensis]PJJ84012.1 cytochrome c peroxidase [Mucilaginibacter auburnensis]